MERRNCAMENMVTQKSLVSFWNGKHVFLTGHTGFKGSWMSRILVGFGANLTGFALEAEPLSLFRLCNLKTHMNSVIGDIRDA